MIFYRISALILANIQRYDKKKKKKESILSQVKSDRLTENLQAVRCHIYDCINTIYQFIKHSFDNKMSIFEEYGGF